MAPLLVTSALALLALELGAAAPAFEGFRAHRPGVAPWPNNRRLNLLPPAGGVWRGAELGREFLPADSGPAPADSGAAKLARYQKQYPQTPLHVYRSFDLIVGPGVRAWVAQGGILWYNIKTSKSMSWETGASGGFDAEAKLWAAQVRALAPAQVFVTIFHEPDHNVCFTNCTGGGVAGNSPANYRNMWRNIQAVFKQESVANAVWVIDYSVQMGDVALMNQGCTEDSCPPAAAVAPLWPGDDAVDWVFVNLVEKGKKQDRVKADYAAMLNASMLVLRNVNASGHCHCVPSRDKNCHGCDLASKPWGLGAFGSHGEPLGGKPAVDKAGRVKFLQDTTAGMASHPALKAYLYFDSGDSAALFNGSQPEVAAAFSQYLASPAFAAGDAGAPPAARPVLTGDDRAVAAVAFEDFRARRPNASTWRRTQCGHPNGTADIPTRWGRSVNAMAPLPAYPRPRMVRGEGPTLGELRDRGDASNWLNLNGLWEWEAVPCDVRRKPCPGMNPPLLCCPEGNSNTAPPFGRTLEKSILVPFPQESCLSGVAPRTSDGIAMRSWYRLIFDAAQPSAVGQKTLLHFGAVDWQAKVYVNKRLVANHSGGYDGFSADITAALALNQDGATPHELLVHAFDPSETGPQLGGKQRMGVLSNPGVRELTLV
jgi:hypothetical protein